MQWNSLPEFIAMDGYGSYIWGSYGLMLLCMLVEPMLAAKRRRAAWLSAQRYQDEVAE